MLGAHDSGGHRKCSIKACRVKADTLHAPRGSDLKRRLISRSHAKPFVLSGDASENARSPPQIIQLEEKAFCESTCIQQWLKWHPKTEPKNPT